MATADQASVADSFWMRAVAQESCSDMRNPFNIKGIVYYGDVRANEWVSFAIGPLVA